MNPGRIAAFDRLADHAEAWPRLDPPRDELPELDPRDAALALDLPYLTGTEISVTFADTTVHIVGLGFDPDDAAMQQGLRNTRETSLAKWHATEHSVQGALDAIQIHGGYGVTAEYEVGRLLLEAKALEFGEGTSELHRKLIAEFALGIRTQ